VLGVPVCVNLCECTPHPNVDGSSALVNALQAQPCKLPSCGCGELKQRSRPLARGVCRLNAAVPSEIKNLPASQPLGRSTLSKFGALLVMVRPCDPVGGRRRGQRAGARPRSGTGVTSDVAAGTAEKAPRRSHRDEHAETARQHRAALAALTLAHRETGTLDVLSTVDALVSLATALCATDAPAWPGDLAESAHRLREVLAILQREQDRDDAGVDHALSMPPALGMLAIVVGLQGDAEECLRLRRAAVAALRRAHGEDVDRADIAAALRDVGDVHEQRSEFVDATHWYREALAMLRRVHGGGAGDHSDTALTMRKLGDVLFARGDIDGCLREHRAAVDMLRRVHGGARADHVDIAASMRCLALTLVAKGGRLPEAQRLLRDALAMLRRLHGDDGDDLDVRVMLSLADAQHYLRDLDGSERLSREGLALSRRVFGVGADHPRVAACLSTLATVMLSRGNAAEAARLQRESYEMTRRIHGDGVDHDDLAESLSKLANVALGANDIAAADRLYRAALAMYRRLYGASYGDRAPRHDIATCLAQLGSTSEALGDLDGSIAMFRDALAMSRRLHGADADHPIVATLLDSLGGVLHVKGEEAESVRLLRQSAAMFRRLRDTGAYADHPNMMAMA
jgi:tetratricopeptide (TPR) repeat protein